jgi:hypothetical protein
MGKVMSELAVKCVALGTEVAQRTKTLNQAWEEAEALLTQREAQVRAEEREKVAGLVAEYEAKLAAIKEGADFIGCFTGLYDRNGNKVYFGDTLDFDPREWGGPFQFQVNYEPSDVSRANDIKAWCTKIDAATYNDNRKG